MNRRGFLAALLGAAAAPLIPELPEPTWRRGWLELNDKLSRSMSKGVLYVHTPMDPEVVARVKREWEASLKTADAWHTPVFWDNDEFVCLSPAEGRLTSKDGIDRKDSSRGYEEGNVAPCCKRCNYAKREMTLDEFRAWVTRVYHGLSPAHNPLT